MKVAIIGGTGMGNWAGEGTEIEVPTPFGPVFLKKQDRFYFLGRHGKGHSVPPHQINYRANFWALKEVGVEGVFATFAVGSLREDLPVGSIVLLDDFLDFTTQRPKTIFKDQVVHQDLTTPYSSKLREVLLRAGEDLGLELVKEGCYVCTDGPRYETPAEVRMFGRLGGDVVGMTGVPEVVFANELGLAYAGIAMVTNLGAGLGSGPLSHEDVEVEMKKLQAAVGNLLLSAIEQF